MINGGRFDFDDGGTYCGGWEDGKAHGHGVCTGPKGQGEYSGAWHYGFEVSGVYAWPSGNSYEGQWQNGKRHGLGVERRGRWVYRGEWTQGYKGRYGVRQSTNSQARYEGTWANGLQDGYGTETYADGGTYQGQWLRGMRHGYGVRRSAQYSVAAKYRSRSHAHASLTSLRSDQGDELGTAPSSSDGKEKKGDDSRGGFVLRARSEPPGRRRSLSERSVAVKRSILQGLRIKKQRSTGDISQRVGSGTGSIRSSGSTGSCASDESAMTGCSGHDHGSFIGVEEFVDPSAVETYMGEWKNDKRSGFGVSERSDGLKYEGEWFNNKKSGYGITTLKDGTKEEGKYKGNILITSQRKKNLIFVRSSKLRERIDSAVSAANRASQIAVQKAEIAVSRATTSRDRGDQADLADLQAREDSDLARLCAKQFAPDFHQPGIELLKKRQRDEHQIGNHVTAALKPVVGAGETAHTLGSRGFSTPNYVGGGVGHNENYPITSSGQATPMFTPLEEHHPVMDQANRRQQLTLGRLQPSFELDTPGGALMQNDSSVIPGGGRGPYDDPYTMSQMGRQQLLRKEMAAYAQRVNSSAAETVGSFSPHAAPMSNAATMAHHQQTQRSIQPGGVGPAHHHGVAGGMEPIGRDSPTISRTPSQSSSRYSLNQIINDHFDQYTIAANPSAAKVMQANLARQQQWPTAQQGPLDNSLSSLLTRRSTLASSGDWRAMLSATFDAVPERTVGGALRTETVIGAATAPHRSTALFQKEDVEGGSSTLSKRPITLQAHRRDYDETRGSLPDVSELDKNVSRLMPREEIARMSSQRRQELQRMQEEAELLRNNPFRYLRYLYHPSVRAWVIRWKLPLLVLLVNVALSFGFYRLLTYSTDGSHNEDRNGKP